MARMYPPQLPDRGEGDGIGGAERVLYREFARQLGPDYTVLHSVHWLAPLPGGGGRSRDGEADFVVAHPRHGVLVLEVKGGAIRRDQATLAWTSEDLGGQTHPIKDPFEQAERNAYASGDTPAGAIG